jgi:putative copper export protein
MIWLPPSTVARGLCDMALMTALLTIFGGTAFWITLGPAATVGEPSGLRLSQRILGLLQLGLWPLKLLLVVGAMAGTSVIQAMPFVTEVLRDTHYGRDWIASAPLAALLAAVLLLPVSAARRWAAFALSGALLFIWALSSHATDFGAAAILAYFVHELAAAAWVGSLVSFWFFARCRPFDVSAGILMARRVSAAAGWCVVGLLATGLYSTYTIAGLNPYSLLGSSYGRILLLKISVFAVIVTIGGYNRFRIIPAIATLPSRRALIRNVAFEVVLMMTAFALAGLLANSPPPR